jgi:hypothetical protein
MSENLNVRIPFAPDDTEDNQMFAASLIVKHEAQFLPFFDRHIKEDARYTFLTGSLEVSEIEIDDHNGRVSITFTSDFYAGCRDQNGTEDHEEFLEFEVRDGYLIFDIKLPPRWVIDN